MQKKYILISLMFIESINIIHASDNSMYQAVMRSGLIEAVKRNDIDEVRRLISYGFGVNERDEHQATPLHLAVLLGNNEMVKILLQAGARVNAIDVTQRTPLHLAAYQNNMHIIRRLIRNGAILDAQDINNATPLHLASSTNNVDMINILLHHHANIDPLAILGHTPLTMAITTHSHNALTTLIEHNANLEAQLGTELGEILGQSNQAILTPLHTAALANNAYAINMLIQHGIDVDTQCLGMTPLHFAVAFNNQDAIQALINNGADTLIPNPDGITPHETMLEQANRNTQETTYERIPFIAPDESEFLTQHRRRFISRYNLEQLLEELNRITLESMQNSRYYDPEAINILTSNPYL